MGRRALEAPLIRVFVGVPVPDLNRELLAKHLELGASLAPDFRWVRPEGLHLTLRFIGEVDPEQLDRLGRELAQVHQAAFRLTLGSAGSFGRGRRTRVLWLGVAEGSGPLCQLAETVEGACIRTGLPAEIRPFSPHLTLARSRDREGVATPVLPGPPDLQPWLVDEFLLYRSQPQRAGAVYTILRRYSLTRPSRPG